MIDFSNIKNDSVIGKIFRKIAKIFPKNIPMPIIQGKLAGKKWIIKSGVLGYWLGTYELAEQKLFQKNIKDGDVVYDIGANVGFYTILASIFVGSAGKVFSFEPFVSNLNFLKKHVLINKCNNVEIIEAAVIDKERKIFFNIGENNATGKINFKPGGLEVRGVSIDELVRKKEISVPNFMKIDVEGAELLVLDGAREVIEKFHPAILLATHSDELFDKCTDFLVKMGYSTEIIDKFPPRNFLAKFSS